MDGVTRIVHDTVPLLFSVLKARNKKQYDVAKHLLFQLHGAVDVLLKTLGAEHREFLDKEEL